MNKPKKWVLLSFCAMLSACSSQHHLCPLKSSQGHCLSQMDAYTEAVAQAPGTPELPIEVHSEPPTDAGQLVWIAPNQDVQGTPIKGHYVMLTQRMVHALTH